MDLFQKLHTHKLPVLVVFATFNPKTEISLNMIMLCLCIYLCFIL